jgi:hypothetical protein
VWVIGPTFERYPPRMRGGASHCRCRVMMTKVTISLHSTTVGHVHCHFIHSRDVPHSTTHLSRHTLQHHNSRVQLSTGCIPITCRFECVHMSYDHIKYAVNSSPYCSHSCEIERNTFVVPVQARAEVDTRVYRHILCTRVALMR